MHNIEKWHKDIENDKDNLQNIKWIWSEWEYFSRFMLNYDPKDDWMKAAVGFEYSYDMIRPAWAKIKTKVCDWPTESSAALLPMPMEQGKV